MESILNGAFADILSYGTPLYNVKNYRDPGSIGIWNAANTRYIRSSLAVRFPLRSGS
jgi:hypothetical protein